MSVSIFYAHRNACQLCCCVLFIHIALVSGVAVVPLNSTSVRVSWTPVNLTVVDHYTVHYTTVGGVSGIVSFPATSSSGVVSGLQGGQEYWFSVTVTLNVSGELFTGSSDYTLLPPVTCELFSNNSNHALYLRMNLKYIVQHKFISWLYSYSEVDVFNL